MGMEADLVILFACTLRTLHVPYFNVHMLKFVYSLIFYVQSDIDIVSVRLLFDLYYLQAIYAVIFHPL